VTFFELALEYPALATSRMNVAEESPIVGPLQGGVVADLGLATFNSVTLTATLTGRGYGAAWEGNFPLTASVWGLGADFGARFSPASSESRLVNGWFGVGSGLRGEYLVVEHWEQVATAGLGAWTGGGVNIGKGNVRAALAVRADVTLRVDSWNGTVMTGNGTTTWSYWPGSARIVAQAGVNVR
jgi:hypothetical protein